MVKKELIPQTLTAVAALTLVAAGLALSAAAQAPPTKPANCNAYKLNEEENRIVFNDPKPHVLMPEKKERDSLRAQGAPGQIFVMKNCNTPDFEADVGVHKGPDDPKAAPAEKVPSAVRVVILGEKDKWIQVKGHTRLWSGTGWVHLTDSILVVRY